VYIRLLEKYTLLYIGYWQSGASTWSWQITGQLLHMLEKFLQFAIYILTLEQGSLLIFVGIFGPTKKRHFHKKKN